MARVDDYLHLIDDPTAPPLAAGEPDDEALHALLVHLAVSDGEIGDDEFALLQRVRSDLAPGELLEWAVDLAATPLDPALVAPVARTGEERWSLLRFAARMVCLDGEVAPAELEVIEELADALGLPSDATRRVVDEVVARAGQISGDRVRDALRHMLWRRLVPSRDPLEGALAEVVPDGVEAVCSLHLDGDEVAGLFVEGLVARFRTDDGEPVPTFVRFDQVATWTRVPVPGAAFHLRTRDGTSYSVRDHRLMELGALLDFIVG